MGLVSNTLGHIWQAAWWQRKPPDTPVTQEIFPLKLIQQGTVTGGDYWHLASPSGVPWDDKTHTHTPYCTLSLSPLPSHSPSYYRLDLRTSERYSASTCPPSKATPRLVIPNWRNRDAACSPHMEATKHLKKMKDASVLISCLKAPLNAHTHFLSLLVDTDLLFSQM